MSSESSTGSSPDVRSEGETETELEDLEPNSGPCLGLNDRYDPIDPPSNFPKIDYLPLVLRRWTLSIALTFFAACLAGVIVVVVLDTKLPDRLHGKQLVYRRLFPLIPSIAGAVTSIWYASIYSTYLRIAPYQAMASESVRCRPDTQQVKRVNKKALYRHRTGLSCYRVDTICRFTSVVAQNVLTAAKAALLEVQPTNTGWIIVPSHTLAYICMIVYFMILLSVLGMMISFHLKPSGLKWDPSSLTSQISLLTFCDSNGILEGLEFGQWRKRSWFFALKDFPEEEKLASHGVFRLGYWKHAKSGYIIYGIRLRSLDVDLELYDKPADQCPHQASEPFTVSSLQAYHESALPGEEGGRRSHPTRKSSKSAIHYTEDESPLDNNGRIVHEPELAAFGHTPFPLTDRAIMIFEVLGVTLLIVWVIVMFRYDLRSPTNLVTMPAFLQFNGYRHKTVVTFFLAFFLSLFRNFFFVAAENYRSMEPLRGLKESRPVEQSILLDYISPDAFTTIARALSNRHWRVAWFSFLDIFSQTTPIMAARILRQTGEASTDGKYTFRIDPFYFYFTFGLAVVTCISLLFTRMPAPYCAPHYLRTALDLYPYIYHSNLARYPEFITKHPLDEEKHLNAQILFARRTYHFGLYLCNGGRRHIGIASERPLDKIIVKRGWLHFNYRFFYRPIIQRFIDRPDTPAVPRHGADSFPRPAREHSIEDDLAPLVSTGKHNTQTQATPGAAMLTHRSPWTDRSDWETGDMRIVPLRNLRCSTWPRRQQLSTDM